MVSGFLTSPWDHCRMSSAVARPMRSSSKKLTSSTWLPVFRSCLHQVVQGVVCRARPARGALTGRPASDLFDAARLTPGQVDAQFFRCAEDVLVGVPELD